jgi:hypothetical protein
MSDTITVLVDCPQTDCDETEAQTEPWLIQGKAKFECPSEHQWTGDVVEPETCFRPFCSLAPGHDERCRVAS